VQLPVIQTKATAAAVSEAGSLVSGLRAELTQGIEGARAAAAAAAARAEAAAAVAGVAGATAASSDAVTALRRELMERLSAAETAAGDTLSATRRDLTAKLGAVEEAASERAMTLGREGREARAESQAVVAKLAEEVRCDTAHRLTSAHPLQ
jgi:type IV secretory pathway TrbL component